MAGRLLILFVFLVPSAVAQFDVAPPNFAHRVRVHITLPSGTDCDASTKVELMKSAAASVGRASTDRSCTVEFFGVPAGVYRLTISGRGFASVETSELAFTSPDTESVEVTIPHAKTKAPDQTILHSAATSVADLSIPKRAAKEFNKANREMEQQDWSAAIATLQKAIGYHPQYAAAYNNLGVVYARIGDRNNEAAALQHAIDVDRRYAPAYVNLARMDIATSRFPEAENLLKNADSIDPSDGETLVLLAYVEFMNHHLDDAVNDCKRVHAMGNVPHSFAHWVAAFALEQKNQIAQAGEEFRAFVSEEPTGDRADAARKELINIQDFLSEK